VLDLLGRHVGALERALDGQTAELRGVERAEAAAELADRRAAAPRMTVLGMWVAASVDRSGWKKGVEL
jgi:hypothetical protein